MVYKELDLISKQTLIASDRTVLGSRDTNVHVVRRLCQDPVCGRSGSSVGGDEARTPVSGVVPWTRDPSGLSVDTWSLPV